MDKWFALCLLGQDAKVFSHVHEQSASPIVLICILQVNVKMGLAMQEIHWGKVSKVKWKRSGWKLGGLTNPQEDHTHLKERGKEENLGEMPSSSMQSKEGPLACWGVFACKFPIRRVLPTSCRSRTACVSLLSHWPRSAQRKHGEMTAEGVLGTSGAPVSQAVSRTSFITQISLTLTATGS